MPFCRYNGGAGRRAQAEQWGWVQGGWPEKNAEFLLHVLKNAESSAELKGLDADSTVMEHTRVSGSPKMRPRPHRARGRMNPSVSAPCHTEMLLPEKEQAVPEPEDGVVQKEKISQKKLRKQKPEVKGLSKKQTKQPHSQKTVQS